MAKSPKKARKVDTCEGMGVDLSVIIVNWNTRDLLIDCVRSVYDTTCDVAVEVIVVDNASSDGSVCALRARFPNVVVVENRSNLGFARGNNVGLKQAQGQYVSLVNSDVVVQPRCFQVLLAALKEHPTAGLVGPRLLNKDGSYQLSAKRLPTVWNNLCLAVGLHRLAPHNRWLCGPEMTCLKPGGIDRVEVLAGAFWVMPRAVLEELGYLDEAFFFYGEDVDWCKRMRDAGREILFVNEACAIHLGGASSAADVGRFSSEFQLGRVVYWRKHCSCTAVLFFCAVRVLHHCVRIGYECVGAIAWPGTRAQRFGQIASRMRLIRELVFLWLKGQKGH